MARERTDYLGRDGYTWWIGEVEDISDPAQLGRVRVRIMGWYTGHQAKEDYIKTVPKTVIPWATVLLPCDAPQTKNAGTTGELQPGAWVLGFFLDGDEAQQPIVLGAFRGFQDIKGDAKTTIADGTNAKEKTTNGKLSSDMTGTPQLSGAPFTKDQTKQPAGRKGTEEQSRGAISAGEKATPGNAVTNPIKPPVEPQSIANGVAGSAGKGFDTDLSRMLTELGTMAAALGAGPGAWVSLLTGNKVAGDKVKEHFGKLINFLAGGISGILAPLKEFLAKIIAEAIALIVKIISNFIPLAVIMAILELLDTIFALFCAKKPAWLGLVQGAIMDTANFANQMASTIVDKISAVIAEKVGGVMNRILGGIQKTMAKIQGVANDILAAVQTARNIASKAGQIGGIISMIMKFDFTSLNWGSLIGLIKAILGLLFKRSCDRKIKPPSSQIWFPLIGTTECDNIVDAVRGTPYESWEGYKSSSNIANSTGGSSFIDDMFNKIDPYLMQVETFLNGSKVINDSTPGVEKQIISGPGGVTTFQDSWGNEHKNVPNNETKIVAKDKCETIKGNYVLTIEGDFYLKVMGNYHEEVIGAKNENKAQGPQAKASGTSSTPVSGNYGNAKASDQSYANKVYKSDDTGDAGESLTYALKGQTLYDNRDNKYSSGPEGKATFLKWSEQWGGFYPVDSIPYRPDADEYGRTPYGPQLTGQLVDDKEQRSGVRLEGDHDISYTGDVRIQGNKIKMTGIEAVNINAQTVKIDANAVEIQADGEITFEANWITSFLNAGRIEVIAIFNPFAAITGQFTFCRGSIVDITTDLPFPTIAPPTQTRIGLCTIMPNSFNDILLGASPGIHSTFILSPAGTIAEFCTSGANITTVVAGMIATSVATGYMATGVALGPHQVYGLPLMLN